ncbi:MAG: hypothetical protein JG761_1020 [Proteiniphilum sp.]|nr:hypothetical protein [Proteiniphilum sp.]MDK2851871.1 hypothetical protein [Proteiniphilum sp.]
MINKMGRTAGQKSIFWVNLTISVQRIMSGLHLIFVFGLILAK